MLKRISLALVALCALTLSLNGAGAQSYPNKPVTLVVAFTPGGPSDVLARIVGKKMQEILGQPFIIENRPGAGGNIAADAVAKATDGHTLGVMINGNLTIARLLNPKTPYDPLKDFTPIANLVLTPQVMVATSNGPAKPAKQFLADAQAGGKLIDYAMYQRAKRVLELAKLDNF